MSNPYCIVTTINSPTKAIEELHNRFGSNLIVVGDKKTPTDWNYKDVSYIPIKNRHEWFEGYDPANHYARKNIGYMEAIKNKATLIYDTDDDNIPNENWKIRLRKIYSCMSNSEGWFNVYQSLGVDKIWPRGFSLKHVNEDTDFSVYTYNVLSSIQQGLSDGEPDVDAIWRLVINKKNSFEINRSMSLMKKTWCPFNSQSTWWFPKAYPLMYLPINCSFRMTDIWRSFIAQRCLWEIGESVTFHSPAEVFQDRNEHDLLKDFEDEVEGYLKNDFIVEILSNLKLKEGEENICDNMLACYQSLTDKNIFPEMEIRSVKSWIRDYEKFA